MAALAHKNATDPEMPIRLQVEWHSRYTNTVLALNQLLKDSQYRDYEERMREIEEYAKEGR